MLLSEQKRAYRRYQYRLGDEYLAPLLQEWGISLSGKKVLDIGCAEAGVLCAFVDAGATCTGIEISLNRLLTGKKLAEPKHLAKLQFITADFFYAPLKPDEHTFDLITLRDVYEHLPEKQQVLTILRSLMGSETKLLITFPPFYSPFGGHQQLLKSKLRVLPYFHIFPRPLWTLFRFFIARFDNNAGYLKEIEKLRKYRTTIHSFLKNAGLHGFNIAARKFYLVRPSHHLRYHLPVIGGNLIGKIPALREFLITGAFFLLEKKQ